MSTFSALIEESLAAVRGLLDDVLLEGKPKPSAPTEWGVLHSNMFEVSLREHMVVFPDLPEKLAKFLEVKMENPLTARYGKHDRPFTGPLVGFWHAHLRDDAILIYNLKNRCVHLVCICSHAEMEGKRAVKLGKKIAAFKA
jgi:mRNA-degrading endonuclease YafQ of YafQ-DinJ toxin-antitoxin module